MAQLPLLFIFQRAIKANAILLQHPLQVAGWLRLNAQADTQK
jgi:hypothetical protein